MTSNSNENIATIATRYGTQVAAIATRFTDRLIAELAHPEDGDATVYCRPELLAACTPAARARLLGLADEWVK